MTACGGNASKGMAIIANTLPFEEALVEDIFSSQAGRLRDDFSRKLKRKQYFRQRRILV